MCSPSKIQTKAVLLSQISDPPAKEIASLVYHLAKIVEYQDSAIESLEERLKRLEKPPVRRHK
jgi:phosphoribosyl-ATP pyrophosphohydrolase